jgi:hypothetical protein
VKSQKPASTGRLRSAIASARRCPGEAGQDAGDHRDEAEHDLGPDHGRGATEHRSEQHSDDRGGERRPDQLAAPLGRGRGHEPRHPRCPHAGAAHTLREARQVEQHDRVGEREDEARAAEQPEAEQQRRLDSPTGGEPAGRQGRCEGAGRVGGGEHARPRLRQVELVGVLGQQR